MANWTFKGGEGYGIFAQLTDYKWFKRALLGVTGGKCQMQEQIPFGNDRQKYKDKSRFPPKPGPIMRRRALISARIGQ